MQGLRSPRPLRVIPELRSFSASQPSPPTRYARVTARTPVQVKLNPGERFSWCTCGYSSNSPYCDGAHKAINIQDAELPGFEPMRSLKYTPAEGADLEFWACQCKQTQNPPFCDGRHNQLDQGPKSISASEFLPYDLISTHEQTHDTVSLQLRVQSEALPKLQLHGAAVGPAFHFSVRVATASGKMKSRPYTPVNYNQNTGEMELLVKRYPDGAVSPVVYGLRPGDQLEVRGPLEGSFNYQSAPGKSLALFAAGTGVTPILQLARAVLADPSADCVVFCAFKSQADMLCADHFKALSAKSDRIKVIHVIEDAAPEDGFAGRISKQILDSTGLAPTVQAVVCGPPLFNRAVREMLTDYGCAPERIAIC